MSGIRFRVSYGFQEYQTVCLEHVANVYPQGIPRSMVMRALGRLVMLTAFTVKRLRLGTCDFDIDESGIARQTRSGRGKLEWSHVTAIYRYSGCYLIKKKDGALPIPYRCLDVHQRAELEGLLAKREAELKACVAQ